MFLREPSSTRSTAMSLQEQDVRAFPVTPSRSGPSTSQTSPASENDTNTPPTLQHRRGRRQGMNGAFRPLSVFTRSMLIPFNENFERAFDVLESDSPDRLQIAQNILSPEYAGDITFRCVDKRRTDATAVTQEPHSTISPQDQHSANPPAQRSFSLPDKEAGTPHRAISKANMLRQRPKRDIDMDLLTALKATEPDEDSVARIGGDFETLCELPVPDPCDHPVSARNPFEVKTAAPLLFTSTAAQEIRSYGNEGYKSRDKDFHVGGQSVERKISLFGLGLNFSTPSLAKSRNAFTPPTDLPLLTPASSSYTESIRDFPKEFSRTTTDINLTRELTSPDKNRGIRNFPGLFRRRNISELSEPDSPAWSPRTSVGHPTRAGQDLEQFLRRTTVTPTYEFDPGSSYPRHPNTGRGWKSRNLKCTTCSTDSCAVCNRVCCAYKAAVLALENHNSDSPARSLALQRIQEITKLYPYGQEAPTFLQCTTEIGGVKNGCGKTVCPDCCGICPDPICQDTVCRKCKPEVWEECHWHKIEEIFVGK